MMRRVLFLPFLVVLTLGLSALQAPPSDAYSLGSCQWGAVTSLRWSNFSGTTGIYETAVNTGASRWNATSTPVSISQTASGNPTNFQVNTANFGNVSWVGRAPNFDTCPAGFYNAALPLQLNTYYLASYSATRRAGIAAHEFGHNLGLRHVRVGHDAMRFGRPDEPISSTHARLRCVRAYGRRCQRNQREVLSLTGRCRENLVSRSGVGVWAVGSDGH